MPEICSCGTQLVEAARFCHRCGKPQGDLLAPEEPETFESIPEPEAPALKPPPLSPLADVALSEISFHNRAAVAVAMLVALVFWLITFVPLPPVIAVPLLFIDLLAGGFFAVWFYARRTGQTLTVRSGAHLGWLTGVFCFVIGTVVAAINMLLIGFTADKNFWEAYKKVLIENGQAAGDVEKLMQGMQDPSAVLLIVIFSMAFFFAVFVLLPVLGAMLGAKVLED